MVERVMVGLVRLYRTTFGGLLGGQCRFHPSCSEYAIGAIRERGPLRGSIAAIRRVIRCGPWSPGGIDYPARSAGVRG